MPKVLKRHPTHLGCGVTDTGGILNARTMADCGYVLEGTTGAATATPTSMSPEVLARWEEQFAFLDSVKALPEAVGRQSVVNEIGMAKPGNRMSLDQAARFMAGLPLDPVETAIPARAAAPAPTGREARLAAIKANADAYNRSKGYVS